LRREGGLVKFVVNDDAVAEDEVSPLKKIDMDGPPATSNGEDAESAEGTAKLEEPPTTADMATTAPGETVVDTIPSAQVTTPSPSMPSSLPSSPVAAIQSIPAMDPHLKLQLLSLESYVANLHLTELSLRQSLMRAIDKGGGGSLLQISTLAVATAADEAEGDADAEDWRYFLPEGEKKMEEGGTNENDADGGTEADESDAKAIKWSSGTKSHPLIGRVMYRPQSSPLRPLPEEADDNPDEMMMGNEKCHWYRIVSYTPSVRAVEEVTPNGGGEGGNPLMSGVVGGGDNTIVERRMRFRAVPISESDIDEPYYDGCAGDDGMDEDDDIEYMILTEGQARAGVEAAALHRRIEGRRDAKGEPATDPSTSRSHFPHPYKNGHGTRVMLTPRPQDNVKEENDRKFDVLYGVIAGYDVRHSSGVFENRILILLEEEDGTSYDDVGEEVKRGHGRSCAFWSTVFDPDGTLLADITPSAPPSLKDHEDAATNNDDPPSHRPPLCSSYNIDTHEFHCGSPAYEACSAIVDYLKSHSKAGPFLAPVDPVALGIPDYFDVVKQPMDIGTLERNLEEGKYSRIPPVASDTAEDDEDGAASPVYRMAYGPFYDAMMLIFDNCIKYNSAESWIGGESATLKKAVVKKAQQVVSKAVWQGQAGSSGGGGSSARPSSGRTASLLGRASRGGAKRVAYADEDSDVDMYEYESEYEDDDHNYDGGGKRRSRAKRGANSNKSRGGGGSSKKKKGKEDIASKAIEQPFVMPENAHEFGMGGGFPHLKIATNVGRFTLGKEWSCRYIEEDAGEGKAAGDDGEKGDAGEKKESEDDEDEMLILMQLQQQQEEEAMGSVRRSSRARHAPQNYADEEVEYAPSSLAGSRPFSTCQSPVTLPGVEYYLTDDDTFRRPRKEMQEGDEEGAEDPAESSSGDDIPTACRSRLGVEGVRENLHEEFYARLYRDHSPNALILDSGYGKYIDGSFPPYLGRVVPGVTSDKAMVWEIREQYLVPALRWILRGLVRSGHLSEVDGSLSDGDAEDAPSRSAPYGAGVVVPSHEYYCDHAGTASSGPYDVLDEKEIARRRRMNVQATGGEESSSDDEVELSEYEQMRAARVARNAERLKALGLA